MGGNKAKCTKWVFSQHVKRIKGLVEQEDALKRL